MQDSIIGYLLGALDEEELAQFEAQLERDPDLQERVREAAQSLKVLRKDPDDIEPPLGLVESTCAFVYEVGQAALSPVRRFEAGAADNEWTMVDIMVACSVVLAGCLLLFPAINNSRYHAQIAGCQNNLRSIGRALIEYSGADPQGLFPEIPQSGNLAVAGMYAPTLLSHGLVEQDNKFFCPSSIASHEEPVRDIPELSEIHKVRGQQLAVVQLQMGGDYGYTLGVRKNDRVCGVKNQSRTHFPIMSDSPNRFRCDQESLSKLHRNVLFEGGGVRIVCVETECWFGDQLYTNDRGEVSAGLHDGDAVIGSSGTSPIIFTSYTGN